MKTLNEMTGPELVSEYNRLAAIVGVKEVTRFADRKSGLRRIEGLIAQLPEQQEQANADITEFEEAAEAAAVVVKGKKVYPLEWNHFHARNNKKLGRGKDVIPEMVFQALLNNREGQTTTDEFGTWAMVYLDNAVITGMHLRIWAGQLRGLNMKGRYRKVKGHNGAFGEILVG